MPNYFIFTGPNATVGHGSLIFSLEWAADWMVKWLRKMLAEDIASVSPRQDVVDEFVRYGDEIMKRFTWTAGCKCTIIPMPTVRLIIFEADHGTRTTESTAESLQLSLAVRCFSRRW